MMLHMAFRVNGELVTDEAIKSVVSQYTRESGLRNLERLVATLCRKTARLVAEGKTEKTVVDGSMVAKFLGPAPFTREDEQDRDEVGIATGLAWTSVGGEILYVETTTMKGKGGIILTGQLGDVMKESGQAALGLIRWRAEDFGIDEAGEGQHPVGCFQGVGHRDGVVRVVVDEQPLAAEGDQPVHCAKPVVHLVERLAVAARVEGIGLRQAHEARRDAGTREHVVHVACEHARLEVVHVAAVAQLQVALGVDRRLADAVARHGQARAVARSRVAAGRGQLEDGERAAVGDRACAQRRQG